MIIETKYDLHDTVLFLKSNSSETGDVEISGGIVKGIKFDRRVDSSLIVYDVIGEKGYNKEWWQITEGNLFKNENDLMKFFKKNMRKKFLSIDSIKGELIEEVPKEYDDLPF